MEFLKGDNDTNLILVIDKDLLYPWNLSNYLVRLFDLLRKRLRFVVAVVAHDPVQILGPIVIVAAFHRIIPLDAAVAFLCVGGSYATKTPGEQGGEELLRQLSPPAPELVVVIRRRHDYGLLHHLEDIAIGAAEELPPIIERSGGALHGERRGGDGDSDGTGEQSTRREITIDVRNLETNEQSSNFDRGF